jgi:hypothetical protein
MKINYPSGKRIAVLIDGKNDEANNHAGNGK